MFVSFSKQFFEKSMLFVDWINIALISIADLSKSTPFMDKMCGYVKMCLNLNVQELLSLV